MLFRCICSTVWLSDVNKIIYLLTYLLTYLLIRLMISSCSFNQERISEFLILSFLLTPSICCRQTISDILNMLSCAVVRFMFLHCIIIRSVPVFHRHTLKWSCWLLLRIYFIQNLSKTSSQSNSPADVNITTTSWAARNATQRDKISGLLKLLSICLHVELLVIVIRFCIKGNIQPHTSAVARGTVI